MYFSGCSFSTVLVCKGAELPQASQITYLGLYRMKSKEEGGK